MPKRELILLAILIAYKSVNGTPQQIVTKHHTSSKTPGRLFTILSSILALGLAVTALTIGTQTYVAEAQEQDQTPTTETTTDPDPIDETTTENNQEQPEPQIPNEVGSVYNDQMILEEVIAECQAGAARITNEFNRLTDNIQAYEISHPEYYETEKAKIGIWLTETTDGHNTECEEQKDAALARREPPSPIPEPIATSYHDQMTLDEVEAECENIDQRIAAEYGRLLTLIEDFKDSHPEYHAEEQAELDAWQQLTDEEQQTQCEEQKDAALARQLPPTPVDDLYPQIPQEVKDFAAELGLTDEAKTIFYNNNPELFDDPGDPGFTCSDHALEEKVYVYGCWDYHGSIKVLRDNSTAITLAHELLHAVYYDAYISYRNRDLNRQIDATAADDPVQTQIILNAYANQLNSLSPQAARYVRYTELHSFIGTQFTNISPDLEEHYGQYFEDRQVVLNIFRDWLLDTRAKLAERQEYNQQLLYQVGEYQKCLVDPHATTAICRRYLPNEKQYLAYDECLSSNKTFLRDCRRLKPPASVAFVPIPAPPTPPPAGEPDNQSAIETAELIDRTNQRQQEAEEDFVNQLAEYDHELAESPGPEASIPDPEDQEENQTESSDEDDDSEDDEDEQQASLIQPKSSGSGQLPNVPQEGSEAATLPVWLLLIAAPVAAASSFMVTCLILKTRRRGPGGLLEIQQQAGRIPILPEMPKETEGNDQVHKQDD